MFERLMLWILRTSKIQLCYFAKCDRCFLTMKMESVEIQADGGLMCSHCQIGAMGEAGMRTMKNDLGGN
jgi:hypothetical protein